MSSKECQIAVVGLGGLFPDALTIQEYWKNILNNKVSIRPVPQRLVDADVLHRPELLHAISKENKTVTILGSWNDNFEFDALKYKIPPSIAENLCENQKSMIHCAEQALANNTLKDIDKTKVAVIVGSGSLNDQIQGVEQIINSQVFEHYLQKNPKLQNKISKEEWKSIFADMKSQAYLRKTPVTEDSAPGSLINIAAARISSVFDFHGPAFVVEGACASGLTAIATSVQGLVSGEYDAVVAGATDMHVGPVGYLQFSALNALSQDGSFPFDHRANGFVIGQGAGAVVLKRLEDAIDNQDTIYSIIRGYGQLNDGKGKSTAAPNRKWQAKTVEAAYRMAGYPIDTVELIEAHGTGTPVGDVSEVHSLKDSFSALGCTNKEFCAIGSVKSNIGHLKSAAGIAGFIKATLALHHKTLPPTASIQKINPNLEMEDSPFYVLKEAQEWKGSSNHPRRAGVNSFGFGGSNWHIALEEYIPGSYNPKKRFYPCDSKIETKKRPQEKQVRSELFLFSGETIEELKEEIERVVQSLKDGNDFTEEAWKQSFNAEASKSMRLAILAKSNLEFKQKSELFFNTYGDTKRSKFLSTKGIWFKEGAPTTPEKVAILFPGQGAQYPGMLQDLQDSYPLMRSVYDQADAFWAKKFDASIVSLIFPDEDSVNASQRLKETQNAQPAIYISSLALYKLLQEMGLEADHMVGHSLGEITALTAAGKVNFRKGLELVSSRAISFPEAEMKDPGKMIALRRSVKDVETIIKESELPLYIANINAPDQTIVSGSTETISKFESFLKEKEIAATILNVSHAFHSPVIAPAAELFERKIQSMKFSASKTKVMATHMADYYPNDDSGLANTAGMLVDQLKKPVQFVESVEKLYADGVRLFIEVGPERILAGLTEKILKGKEITILSSNHKKGDDLKSLRKLICGLFVEGVPLNLIQPTTTTDRYSSREEDEKVEAKTLPEKAVNPTPTLSEESSIKVSGASIGLPGSYKDSFRDDNFEQIFEGRNFIEALSVEEKSKLAELQVSKLIKSESGASFKILSSLNEVLQLASKSGKLDLNKNYGLEEKEIANISTCIAQGVAAGYEALKDAGIPMVREYVKTASGALLPSKWALPKEMQLDTGVLFGNGLPMIDPFIREVSRYFTVAHGGKFRKNLSDLYEQLIEEISDRDTKRLLTNWYVENIQLLPKKPENDELYRFNYNLINQIASQANNRLAQLINAKGPNCLISAACSSTSIAISIAEDMIRAGRAKRMIVIGSDDPTGNDNLPWVGAGFLSTGTANNSADIYEAALPFDKRRNGMIMGSGSVGMVLEEGSEVQKRGYSAVSKLLGTHVFNTASHPSRLDLQGYSDEMGRFITAMEKKHGFDRADISSELLYISHETYTPPRGGCSQSEALSLKNTFGKNSSRILVGNTKGMTGHTMGASIEDAVAPKSLQYGKIAPVVNCKYPDKEFVDLNLATGDSHKCRYALRMSAGFGSQGTYSLFEKEADGDHRVVDSSRYQKWLESISDQTKPELDTLGRVLIVKEKVSPETRSSKSESKPDNARTKQQPKVESKPAKVSIPTKSNGNAEEGVLQVFSEITKYPVEMLEIEMEMEADLGIDTVKQATILSVLGKKFGIDTEKSIQLSNYRTIEDMINLIKNQSPEAPTDFGTGTEVEQHEQIAEQETAESCVSDDEILEIFAEVTKYPVEMLEAEMEMEADLGIDTVKQATVLSLIGEKFGVNTEENIQLSKFRTIEDLINLVRSKAENIDSKAEKIDLQSPVPEAKVENAGDVSEEEILEIFAEVTKYPVEMLEAEMEMEADLGIDTVKQATVLSLIGEKFGVNTDENIQLSKFRTIEDLINLITKRKQTEQEKIDTNKASDNTSEKPESPAEKEIESKTETAVNEEDILNVFSEITKYPIEMLESDMEMEADLGIDTVKQATILSILAEKFNFSEEKEFQLSKYRTIHDIVELVKRGTQRENSLSSEKNSSAGNSDSEDQNTNQTASSSGILDLSRQVPRLFQEPLKEKVTTIEGKKVLIIGSNQALLQKLEQSLQQKGAIAISCYLEHGISFENAVETFRKLIGDQQIDVVIDAAHTGMEINIASIERETPEQLLQSVEARFAIYQNWQNSHKLPKTILSLSTIDGFMGMDLKNLKVQDPFYGALKGFYKSLRKEWSGVTVKCVDFAPNAIQQDWQHLFDCLVKEIEHEGIGIEITWNNQERSVVKMVDVGAPETMKSAIQPNSTFVVTGGTSGISNPILTAMAKEYPVKFALIGRTKLPENIEELEKLDEKGLADLKQEIAKNLQEKQGRVTPVMVEKEFKKMTRSIAAFRNIQKIKSLGREIEYYPCDIRNYEDLEGALNQIRKRFNAIHGIIHAAGIDHSQMMTKKKLEEFREVFRVKVEGAMNLTLLTAGDPIRWIFAFSSISGRFGNAAQTDYSAANDFLNYWVKAKKSKNPDCHAVSINWSAWKDFGMAWENENVRESSEEIGLNFIEPESGTNGFLNLLNGKNHYPEIVLHKGLGPMLEADLNRHDLHNNPLIDRVVRNQSGIQRIYHRFHVKKDPIIGQHRLGDTCILPGVASMELCLEYYQLLKGGKESYLLKDLAFHNPFKLYHDRSAELYVEGKENQEKNVVEFEIKSEFATKISPIARTITHGRVTICDELPVPMGMNPDSWEVDNSAVTTFLTKEYFQTVHPKISPVMNLGPLFCGNDSIEDPEKVEKIHFSEKGMIRTVYLPEEQLNNPNYPLDQFVFNPCFFDFIYQAGALFCTFSEGRVFLPYEIEEAGILKVPREKGLYTVTARLLEKQEDSAVFNIVIQDSDHDICYYTKNAIFRRINQ